MARADKIEGGVSVSGTGTARISGGITGKGEKYVHPVYKNMDASARAAADKVAAMQVKNVGTAKSVGESVKKANETIKSLANTKGSRTSNTSDKRKIYRGSEG